MLSLTDRPAEAELLAQAVTARRAELAGTKIPSPRKRAMAAAARRYLADFGQELLEGMDLAQESVSLRTLASAIAAASLTGECEFAGQVFTG